MPVNLKVLLIEDNLKDVEMIKGRFTETVEWLRSKNLLSKMKFDTFAIEHIRGTVKKSHKGSIHYYYKDSIVSTIESEINKVEPGDKISILSDVLLTKEEDEKARVNNFNEISLVRTLCDTFVDNYAMYFITSIGSFGSRVWRIFGRDNWKERYIQKGVVELPSKKGISEVLYFLSTREKMSKDDVDIIEKMELEDLL